MEKIKLFQIPYSGLKAGESYRIITRFRLDGQSGVIFQTDNMFSPTTPVGIFTVNLLEDQLPSTGKIFADDYLYVFENGDWNFVGSTTQVLEGNDTFAEIETNKALIGDGLVNNAITLWNQRQEDQKAELRKLLHADEYIKQTEDACKVERQAIKKAEYKLDGLKDKYQKLQIKLEDYQKKINQIQKLKAEIINQEDTRAKLAQQLNALITDVDNQRKLVDQRQVQKYDNVNDELINGLMKQKDFPKEIIGYDWKIKARNQILAGKSYPIVYTLVGKHGNQPLLKIGSSVNFPHRQAVYDYYEDDGYFDEGSMVIISHLLLSNISDPYILELLVRYVFEYRYANMKAYKNEWFNCNLQMLNDLQSIFTYMDEHLQVGGVLDTFIKDLVKMPPDKRHNETKKQAEKIAMQIFK